MNIRPVKLGAIAVIVATCTSACIPKYSTNIGRNFDQMKTREFIVGTTTIDEAVRQVGPPAQTIRNKEGRTALIWRYSGSTTELDQSRAGATIRKETMAVFDEQGKFLRIQNEVLQTGESGIHY